MGKIIAIANQKGGVGKTLVDADPQANSTSGMGINPKDVKVSVYECMVDSVDPRQAIVKNDLKYLDILPSHIDLVGAEVEMVNIERREERMRDALGKLKNEYEFIIIDCSPSLGLITINALTAADSVIIPVQCEYFALEGLGKLLNTIKIIQTRLNTHLEIEGILLTLYDSRTSLGNQVVEEIRTHFKNMAFKTIIPRNVRLSESPSFGLPAIVHDAESKGAISYLNLAREILDKNAITR